MIHDDRPTPHAGVSVLGLGAMGSALAAQLLESLPAEGRRVTVWNRTAGRADELVARGADAAATASDAVLASPLVVTCLYDHASVREVLDPVAEPLAGRTLVDVTTTTPDEARALAMWAAERGIDYLDGAVMAVPQLIGGPSATILYSGSRTAFDTCRDVLDTWATSSFEGADPGRAALLDHAMLAGMYAMMGGFLHGAAMVAADGIGPREYAERATPFLSAMTGSFARLADIAERGDYGRAGEQSLAWTDLSRFVRASEEQGVDPAIIAAVHALALRQIEAGHGADAFARIFESLRAPAPAG